MLRRLNEWQRMKNELRLKKALFNTWSGIELEFRMKESYWWNQKPSYLKCTWSSNTWKQNSRKKNVFCFAPPKFWWDYSIPVTYFLWHRRPFCLTLPVLDVASNGINLRPEHSDHLSSRFSLSLCHKRLISGRLLILARFCAHWMLFILVCWVCWRFY